MLFKAMVYRIREIEEYVELVVEAANEAEADSLATDVAVRDDVMLAWNDVEENVRIDSVKTEEYDETPHGDLSLCAGTTAASRRRSTTATSTRTRTVLPSVP